MHFAQSLLSICCIQIIRSHFSQFQIPFLFFSLYVLQFTTFEIHSDGIHNTIATGHRWRRRRFTKESSDWDRIAGARPLFPKIERGRRDKGSHPLRGREFPGAPVPLLTPRTTMLPPLCTHSFCDMQHPRALPSVFVQEGRGTLRRWG